MPYNIPNLSLKNAAITPAAFNPIIFTPQKEDMSLLQKSFATLDERKEKTDQQTAAINLALSKVKLNAAEDAWKSNYINQINKRINAAAQFGDYSTALEVATKMAGDVATDPALMGRERANEAFEKYRDQILSRTDLNTVTKDRWLAQNPYSYEDKVDANGNIVGGTEWNPNWRPVSRYDMTKLYGLAKELAAKEAGGGESAQFLDENGNLTSDPSKGFYGMAVKRGTKWERLSEQKLKNVFNSLFKQAPEAMDSLLQDMDDRKWQYNNASDADKKAFIGSDIMDDKGVMRTPEEYLAHRVNPVLAEMAYNHVYSSVDFGQAYALRQKDLKERAAKQEILRLENLQNTTMTLPIEIDLSERAGQSYSNVMSAFSQIKDLWKNAPNVLNNSVYSDLVSKKDYNAIADYLTQNITTKDPAKAAKARQAIALLKSEGAVFKAYIDGMSPEDREAIEFTAARESGADLPDAHNNRYTREYNKKKNEAFTVNVPGTGKTVTAAKIGLEILDNNQRINIERYLNAKGINRQDYAKYGIEFTTNQAGAQELRISKNSSAHQLVIDAFRSDRGFNTFDRYGSSRWGKTNINHQFDTAYANTRRYNLYDSYDNLIPYIGNSNIKAAQYFSMGSESKIAEEAKTKAERSFKNNPNLQSIASLQVLPEDDFNTMKVNELWLNGYIDGAERDRIKKDFNANNLKALGGALENFNNYQVYGRVEENGNAVRLSQSDVQDAAIDISRALSDDRVEISPSSPATGKGYGTIIRIKPKLDSKGDEVKKGAIYYVDGLFDGPAGMAYASAPSALYTHEFQNMRAINARIQDLTGTDINYNDPNAAKRYVATKNWETVLENVQRVKDAGGSINRKDAATTVSARLLEAGYVPGSPVYDVAFEILISKLMN